MVSVPQPTRTGAGGTATRRVYHRGIWGRTDAATRCQLCGHVFAPSSRIVWAEALGACEAERYCMACFDAADDGSA